MQYRLAKQLPIIKFGDATGHPVRTAKVFTCLIDESM